MDVAADTNENPVSGELVYTNNYVGLNGNTPLVDLTGVTASWGFTLAGGGVMSKKGSVGPGGNPIVWGNTGSTNPPAAPPAGTEYGRCNQL